MNKEKGKGKFVSNFGFLMASIGSAVGLGNLWGFPYKMGKNGGFAFLLVYLLLVVTVGFPLVMGEIALGRRTGKGGIQAYKQIDSKFTFNGWFAVLAPVFLLCFYSVFGGYILKYFIANLGDLFNLSFGVGGANSEAFFGNFIGAGLEPLIYTIIFHIATIIIVSLGISGGIEKFSAFAMPTLTVMLIIIVIRACTLPGAMAGLEFVFKPDFTVFKGTGILKVLGAAGSQMFFSLSLSSGAIIAFGSYLDKKANIEKNAAIVTFSDTLIAILAAMAVMPAVFAFNLEPSGGPGLLFVSIQAVFNDLGKTGPFFGTLFYLLVLFAALTSSIAMAEGTISAMLDAQISRGKKPNRILMSFIVMTLTLMGAILVCIDALGSKGLWHPFGLGTWLDVFDLLAEGILMPVGGFFLAILLGWVKPKVLDDELRTGSDYKTEKFFKFCFKYLATPILFFITLVQLNEFFGIIKF
ncbi:MAG: sodium-dependent transporter [Clostridia bacterium]|nr:sodium-dependent transporter [Clostridia bacterium]